MIEKGKVLGFISATRPKPYLHSRSKHSWSLSKIYSPNTLEYKYKIMCVAIFLIRNKRSLSIFSCIVCVLTT